MSTKEKIRIAVLSGDGIGPEIMEQALRILDAVKSDSMFEFVCQEALIGGAAFELTQSHFPEETAVICKESDVVLFGAVGGPVSESENPKWSRCEVNSILALRKELGLYLNLRPVSVSEGLLHLSPLKLERAKSLPDLIVVRELLGDVYFGEKRRFVENGIRVAEDIARYDESQIARVAKRAFEIARGRRKNLVSVDKANVLETSRLWREVVTEVSKSYSDVCYTNMLVDNCAMQIISNPSQFDVILCSNLFGDILSDAAAVIPGSLGLLSSASEGDSGKFLFEPPSGSAPDIAGKNLANPIGMIGCISLIFSFVTKESEIAERIGRGVQTVLKKGIMTRDISSGEAKVVGSKEFVDLLLLEL